MLGAIIGDIVGSRFEWDNHRDKDFEFLTYKCFPTDDSIMSLAIAQAILVSKPNHSDLSKNAIECMQSVGRNYPDCGYGGSFYNWMFSDNPKPYNSYGNGAAMRVSPAGFVATSLKEAKELSRLVTEVTHNHPEGIKGAEATAVAIYLAKSGSSILEIRDYINDNYYPMNFTLDDIRDTSGGDEEFAAFDENHSFVIPDGCHWIDIRNASRDVGLSIVKSMNGIERANPETLSGVFSSFDDVTWTDKSKLSDERLKNLIEHMSSLKVGNQNYSADVMGDAYEYLIKKFADLSKKNAGEYYTPRTIVKLMVMLMDPKPGDTVYDPACGTGGMLIEAIRHINDRQMTYGRIYGQENNLSTSAIARMNLFLHGASDFKIVQGDTLRTPKFIEHNQLMKFNCVLANPPFGQEKWGADSFETDKYGRNMWGCPSDSNADYAWLQHMIKSMKPMEGKVAVVLPQGVLFHGGKEGDIREQLIKSDMIETVIALAGGVFYGTGVSACIIFLNNHKKPEHKGKICLIDATKIYTPKRAQNEMEEKDIQEVYKLYQDYQDVVEKCKIVTIGELDNAGNTLAVNTYIEKKKQKVVSPAIVRENYFKALENVKKAETKMKTLLVEGGYLNEQ